MNKLTRAEALRRAAETRAAIIAYLPSVVYATIADIATHLIKERGIPSPSGGLDRILRLMAVNGQINRSEARVAGGDGRRKSYIYAALAPPTLDKTATQPPKPSTSRPEIRVEATRIIIEHSKCRVIVEF